MSQDFQEIVSQGLQETKPSKEWVSKVDYLAATIEADKSEILNRPDVVAFENEIKNKNLSDLEIQSLVLPPQIQTLVDSLNKKQDKFDELCCHLYLNAPDESLRGKTTGIVDNLIVVMTSNGGRRVEEIYQTRLFLSTFGGEFIGWEDRTTKEKGLSYQFNAQNNEGMPVNLMLGSTAYMEALLKKGLIKTYDEGMSEGSLLTPKGVAVLKRMDEKLGESQHKAQLKPMSAQVRASLFAPSREP